MTKWKYLALIQILILFEGDLLGQALPADDLQVVVQTSLKGNQTSLEYSHDHRFLAAAGTDNTIAIWDVQTGLQSTVLGGHKDMITAISFSPDDRYLISGGDDNMIKLWDLKRNRLEREFKIHGPSQISGYERILQVKFHPQKPIFASSGTDGRIVLSDLEGKKIFEATAYVGDITSLDFNSGGTLLAFSGINMSYIYFIHLNPENGFEPDNADSLLIDRNKGIWSINFYDDEHLTYSTSDGIVIVDLKTKAKRLIALEDGQTAFNLKSSLQKQYLAANISGKFITIWDFETGKQIKTLPFVYPLDDIPKIPDSTLLRDSSISEIDRGIIELAKTNGVDTYKVIFLLILMKFNAGFQGFSLSDNDSIVVMSEKGKIYFKDILSGTTEKRFATPEVLPIWSIAFNETENQLYILEGRNNLKSYSLSKMEFSNLGYIETVDNIVKIRSLNDSILLCLDYKGNFISYNTKTRKQRNQFIVKDFIIKDHQPILLSANKRVIFLNNDCETPASISKLPYKAEVFDVNTTQQFIVFYSENHYPGTIYIWDYKKQILLDSILCKDRVDDVVISNDGSKIAYNEVHGTDTRNIFPLVMKSKSPDESLAEYWENLKQNKVIVYDISSKKEDQINIESGVSHLYFTRHDAKLIASCIDRRLVTWDLKSGGELFELPGQNKLIVDLAENKDGIFASCDGIGGSIRFWDLDSNTSIATLLPVNSSDFVISNKNNFYYSSKNSIINVAFRYGSKSYYFDQFDLWLNRPDEVLKSFRGYDTATVQNFQDVYTKRWEKLNKTTATGWFNDKAPVVDLSSMGNLSGDKAAFSIAIRDPTRALSGFNVWVNDVPLYGLDGVDIRERQITHFDTSISFKLSPGENRVEVSATNTGGIKSMRQNLMFESLASKQKKNLFIVALGISHYKYEKALYYPAKDADDIVRAFEKRNSISHAYENVNVKILVDSMAIWDSLSAVASFIKKADVNDVVMFFVSGHGRKDDGYSFLLYNYQKEKKQTSTLTYTAIDSILSLTSSRSKVLILNTCFSGEIDKDYELLSKMQMYFTDLRESSGTSVLTSSEGFASTPEGVNSIQGARNGLLTFAIKESLNYPGPMPVSVFFQKVMNVVNRYHIVSNIKPTVRYQSINNDFQIQ